MDDKSSKAPRHLVKDEPEAEEIDDYAVYTAVMARTEKRFTLVVDSTKKMTWEDAVLAVLAWANDEDKKATLG